MSVSLSPCSVPGHKPSFTLAEDEMELGLGKGPNVLYGVHKILHAMVSLVRDGFLSKGTSKLWSSCFEHYTLL